LKKKTDQLNRELHEKVSPRIEAPVLPNKKERREERKATKRIQKKENKKYVREHKM
jgi:hypothetical protein